MKKSIVSIGSRRILLPRVAANRQDRIPIDATARTTTRRSRIPVMLLIQLLLANSRKNNNENWPTWCYDWSPCCRARTVLFSIVALVGSVSWPA
jgi:hypothetical protein